MTNPQHPMAALLRIKLPQATPTRSVIPDPLSVTPDLTPLAVNPAKQYATIRDEFNLCARKLINHHNKTAPLSDQDYASTLSQELRLMYALQSRPRTEAGAKTKAPPKVAAEKRSYNIDEL